MEPSLLFIKWCWVGVYQDGKVGGDFADGGNQVFPDRYNAKHGNVLKNYTEFSGAKAALPCWQEVETNGRMTDRLGDERRE